MVRLQYKSLVTKETIDYYLSKIEDDEKKKDLISTVSKFDIRISTKPVLEEEYEEFHYKIWIWRRGTKKRAHIKLYNRLELLKKEEGESKKTILLPSLGIILCWIRTYANVPKDLEEYCEISWRDPSDETSRIAYPRHLKRAERFKEFDNDSIQDFINYYDHMKENGISKEKIVEALKMIYELPKIKEEYQDISDQLSDLRKKRDFYHSDNELLKSKNYELNNECNSLLSKIESANRMLELTEDELNKKRNKLNLLYYQHRFTNMIHYFSDFTK